MVTCSAMCLPGRDRHGRHIPLCEQAEVAERLTVTGIVLMA